MEKRIHNEKWNEWEFSLSDEEVIHFIAQRLSKSNPGLSPSDFRRRPYSKEYAASFRRADGGDASITVGIGNLKRYFGAFTLGFTDGGIRFIRRMQKNFR